MPYKMTLAIVALLLSIYSHAQEDEKKFYFNADFGSAHYASDVAKIGIGYHLGSSHEGHNNYAIQYNYGLRTVNGISTTAGTDLDIDYHELGVRILGGCTEFVCSRVSLGLAYASVDDQLFEDDSQLGFAIAIGGALKIAKNPVNSSQTNITFMMNAWSGFDKPTNSSTEPYDGYFPSIGIDLYF